MTGKVQKIKEWISKTQDGLMDANGNFECLEHEGAFHILSNLDYYIDSLQEEPVSSSIETELDNYIKDNFTIIGESDLYAMDKDDMLAMIKHFLPKEEQVGD